MQIDAPRPQAYLPGKIDHFVPCLKTGVWEGLEVYSAELYPTLCHQPSGYGGIYSARQQQHSASVRTYRHASRRSFLSGAYEGAVVTYLAFYCYVRIVHVYFPIRERLKKTAAQFGAELV